MNKKMSAPKLNRCILNFVGNRHNEITDLVDESRKALEKIVNEMSYLNPTLHEGYWDMWIPVQRGGLKGFGNYKELHEDGDYESYEEFKKAWKECYPKKVYWHKLIFIHDEQCTVLYLDQAMFVSLHKESQFGNRRTVDVTGVLNYILSEVRKIRKMVKKGTYERYLIENLSHEYRYGEIERAELWKIAPKSKENDLKCLETEEIDKFIKFIEKNGKEKPAERLKEMTAGRYFELCADCYKAAEYADLENRTPKQMYERHADNRDGGLSTLDENSSEAFNEWFEMSNDDKWKIRNASHLWEMATGGSFVRMDLRVNKDEDGFYLTLTGGLHCRTDEAVRMFNALCEKGVPVQFANGDDIAYKIQGKDSVGIVPVNEPPFAYWYGGFPNGDLASYIQIDNFEERDEIVKAATWFPVPILRMKEGML